MLDPDVHAARLSRLPLADARAELSAFLGEAMKLRPERNGFQEALDYNARLCTRLRERGVRIWGHEPVAGEDGA